MAEARATFLKLWFQNKHSVQQTSRTWCVAFCSNLGVAVKFLPAPLMSESVFSPHVLHIWFLKRFKIYRLITGVMNWRRISLPPLKFCPCIFFSLPWSKCDMQFDFCELDPAPTIPHLLFFLVSVNWCKPKFVQTAKLNLFFSSSFSFSLSLSLSRCLLAEEPKLVQCKSRPLFFPLLFFHSPHLLSCAVVCWCDLEWTGLAGGWGKGGVKTTRGLVLDPVSLEAC